MKHYTYLLFFFLSIKASEESGRIVLAINEYENYIFKTILRKKKEIKIIGTYINEHGRNIEIPPGIIQQPYPLINKENMPYQKNKIDGSLLRHLAFSE